MKSLLLLLLALPLRAQDQVFPLPLFKDGLHTRYSANVIPDGALSTALNVLLDEDVDGVVVARRGLTKYNPLAISDSVSTASVRGIWPFDATDGTKYFVAFSSQSFYKTSGDGVWTQIPGLNGFSLVNDFDCTQTIGKLWCANGVVIFSWDGTSTSPVSGAPIGSLVGKFRNRVLLSGISGSKGRVRGSGELDGTDWTVQIPGVSTTPFNIAFGGADDGEDVTCMMGAYQDAYIVGKRNSLWGLYGFGRTDFQVRELSREVGCIEQKSVREKNNCLYWLSIRGIEKYCGTSIVRISDPIRDQIDTIVATAGNPRSVTDTTQTDFQAGNLTASGPGAPVSATISAGNLVPSSGTFVDTSSSDFSGGALTNLSITDVAGSVVLSSRVYQDNWVTGGAPGRLAWTATAGDWSTETPPTMSGTWLFTNSGEASGGTSVDLYHVINTSSVTISSGSYTFSWAYNNGLGTYTCSNNSFWRATAGTCFSYRFNKNAGGDYYEVAVDEPGTSSISKTLSIKKNISSVSTTLTNSSQSFDKLTAHAFNIVRSTAGVMTLYLGGVFVSSVTDTALTGATTKTEIAAGGSAVPAAILKNYFTNVYDYQYAPQGSFVSRIFDTTFSTPTWGVLSATFTASNSESEGNIAFYVQSSAAGDGSGFGSLVGSSDTLRPSAMAQKRYFRYRADFSTNVSTKTPRLDAIALPVTTTGYFISQCLNTTAEITSWGQFSCTQELNGGDLTYAIATGPTCHTVTRATATWTAQTNNTPISVATSAFIAYRILFDVDTDTDAPRVRDCTINWKAGASRPPVAASVYKDRYYLAYTSSTANGAVNDHALVLDKNDKWTVFDGHNCYALANYERKLYCGSSTSVGRVWQMDSGTDDDGVAILAKIRTKAFNLGMPERRKSFTRLYLDLEPSPDPTQTITLTGRYTIERSTPLYSLGTVDLNEDQGSVLTAKFPFPLANPTSARYLQIELESSGLNSPWRLFSGRLYYSLLEPE